VQVTVPKNRREEETARTGGEEYRTGFLKNELKVKDLQTALDLPDQPEVIECFDISHLSGTSMVGSMVQFRNGVPDKKNYRRFKIRTIEGIDDFASIAEIVKTAISPPC